MANLIVSTQSEFLAFIRDQAMPNGNLSTRGTARCCGLSDHKALISGGDFRSEKLGIALAGMGFQPGDLTENGFPPAAVWACIEYYAFESRAKAPMAKQLARTFGAIGVMATLSQLSQPVQALPHSGPSKELVAAREVAEIETLLEHNPRLAQCLTDSLINRVLERNALPATQLRGVAEIANEMGYKADASNRVKLGKFIVARGFAPQKESRLCNGVMTPINCYEDTVELRDAIADFFR